MSATPDSTFTDLEQRIADLERQLAEVLERETATAEILEVINSSPSDLVPVFDAILEKAMRLCDASFGILHTSDGERIDIAAYRGVSQAFAEFLSSKTPNPVPAKGLFAGFSRGERFIQIDAPDGEAYRAGVPIARAMVEIEGGRTLLAVPLRKDKAVLGAFVIYRREVRPFSDKQIALLQNFAAQAVIAIENARLITETREALEQQTATAEVLGVINSSPGDLAPVFDAILEKAHALCGVEIGSLTIYDGEENRAVATRGLTPGLAGRLRQGFRPGPAHPIRQLLSGVRIVQVSDVGESADPIARDSFELGGIRTSLYVPLRKDHRLLGLIVASRHEVRLFSDKEITLLENFAAQAVIAMENARLLTETREALEQQTATAEVLGVINSSPGDLAPVFDAMLSKALQLCEAAFGVMITWDGELWHHAAWQGMSAELLEALRWGEPFASPPGGVVDRLVRGEDIISTADLVGDESFRKAIFVQVMVRVGGARSYAVIALRKDKKLLGAIAVYRQEVRPFTDKQIALLQNFAQQAVIAMENARLLTETRDALEQQTATGEVLGVINSSPGDRTPVFEAILEKARILCGAALGSLSLYDGERFRAVAINTQESALAGQMRQGFLPSHYPWLKPLLDGARLVHVPDLVELGHPFGARTGLFVPLRKDGALLGLISAIRLEIHPFTDKQIALLQNFAAQAVIAMENARLLTETREALEQQTATAEVLGVINSSPGDLAPVFDAILEKAHALCGAVQGALITFDGDWFRARATRGMPERFAEVLRHGFAPVPGSPLDPLMRGEPAHTPDLRAFAANSPPAIAQLVQPALELAGTRTLLMVPLCKDGVLLGYIAAYRTEVRPFTDKQIALLQNFAAQAVIAMENARLITETREALEQQTATAEVLQIINSSPSDLTPVFDAMLEKATRLCGAPFGILRTWDGERTHLAAVLGDYEFAEWARQRGPFIPHGAQPIARIISGENIVPIADALGSEAYETSPGFRDLVDRRDIRSLITVALRKDAALLGTVTVYRQEVRPFSDKQIALLENFAAQAVIAMENARLITETREALEQQTATAEVLGVINSSPGDLAPVFDAMLDKAIRLCEATHGLFYDYDGEFFHVVAANDDTGIVEWVRQRGGSIRPPPYNAPLGRISRGERIVHTADMREEEIYRTHPAFREQVDLRAVRSQITLGLFNDNRLLGAMLLYRQEVRGFSEKQIALLQNFAAQAVIAMENARLLGELRQRTEEVAELNRGLEARVAEQVDELGRVGRLKRFLAPQLAELIVSQGDEKILESHRREIVVVFCDLRGYTAFTETAEPEEVLNFLREYHGALGPLVSQFEGTLDQFSGDGIMVFFNDPVPIPDPAERAVKMAAAMREAAGELIASWRRRRGRVLGFGAGIAQGYATLGQIGFAERSGYTAIGTVCNLAARLCAEAKDGQILLAQPVAVAVEETIPVEEVGELALRGLTQPVVAYNVPLAAGHPALRVIEGGPPGI